jgi:hypothetical protein
MLLPGQEGPRTKILGHSMFVGAAEQVRLADDYLSYRRAFESALDLGGVSGIGHSGEWGGDAAVALLGPLGLLESVEVFTFRTPNYALWYEALNAGLRLGATAGSDYPCGDGGGPPGSQRFYVRVDTEGPVDVTTWLNAIRDGRTFVTDGPMLDLQVDGVEIGGEIRLEGPGSVTVSGELRWDPGQHQLDGLNLILGGRRIEYYIDATAPGRIEFSRELRVEQSTWVATSAQGIETQVPSLWRRAFAHSGAIWIDVDSQPPPGRTAVLDMWAARLRELESRLSNEARLLEMVVQGSDAMSLEYLRTHRASLIRDLQLALSRLTDTEVR